MHFTVLHLDAWPLNEREAGVELVLIIKKPYFCYANDAVIMLISRNFLNKKVLRFLSK